MAPSQCPDTGHLHPARPTRKFCPDCGLNFEAAMPEETEEREVLEIIDSPAPQRSQSRATTVVTTPTRTINTMRAASTRSDSSNILRPMQTATGRMRVAKNLEVAARAEEKRPRNYGSTPFTQSRVVKHTAHITCVEEAYYYENEAAKLRGNRTAIRADPDKQIAQGALGHGGYHDGYISWAPTNTCRF